MKNPIGIQGEDKAEKYLKSQRYHIVERNFRTRNGEIDIIAIDKSEKEPVLCFVEVKSRTSNQFGTPLEAITPWKIRFLIRAAQFYKISHKGLPDALRIDAVSVQLDGSNTEKIELLKNITE